MIPISCRKSVEAIDHSFSFEVAVEETQDEDRIIDISVQAGTPSDVFKIKYTIDGGTELELKSEGKTVVQEDILKLVDGKTSLSLPFLAPGSHDVSVTLYNGYDEHTETVTFVTEIRVESIHVEPQTLYYGDLVPVSMTVTPSVHDTPIIASGYDKKVIDIVKIDNKKNTIEIRPLRTGKTHVTLSAGKVTEQFEVTVKQVVRLFISSGKVDGSNSIYAHLNSPTFDDLYVYYKLKFSGEIFKGSRYNHPMTQAESVSGEKKLNNASDIVLISESEYLKKAVNLRDSMIKASGSSYFAIGNGILYISTNFSDNGDCYELDIYYPDRYHVVKPEFNLDPLRHEYVPYEKYLKSKW